MSAHIHNGSLAQLSPRIPLDGVLGRKPFTTAVRLHGQAVPFGEDFVLLEEIKPRQVLVVCKIHARFRRLTTPWPLLHRIDDVRDGEPEIVSHESYPGVQRRVFQEEARRSGMRYEAFLRLVEDMVGHGMPNESAEIQHGHVDFLGEVRVGDGASEGYCFGDFELIHCLEGETVYGLYRGEFCFWVGQR